MDASLSIGPCYPLLGINLLQAAASLDFNQAY
jgi:hypothetical protein